MNYVQFLSCSSDLGNCCTDSALVLILDAARRMLLLIQLIVPIILIVAASVKFIQLVINPEKKNGIKAVQNAFIAAVIVFFVPVVVDVVLGIMPRTFNFSACWDKVKVSAESQRKLKNKYIPIKDSRKSSNIFVDPSQYEKGDKKDGDTGGIGSGSAKGILEGAKKVHDNYEKNHWAYYSSLGELKWNDIKYSTNNPSRRTCCATLVGSAFYVGGVFSEQEINKYNYNSVSGISQLCEAHHWKKITSYSQLAAGDIVVMTSGGSGPGHVQIYAGNGTWYNAGSTYAIQRKNPYSDNASGRFLYAYRKPS